MTTSDERLERVLSEIGDVLPGFQAQEIRDACRAAVETLRRNLADAQKDAAENAEALPRARAEALEEAAGAFDQLQGSIGAKRAALIIRAKKAADAPASVPVEKVREALRGVRTGGLDAGGCVTIPYGQGVVDACYAVAKTLGISLDAAQDDIAALARGEHNQAYWTGAPTAQVHDEPAHDPSPHLCKGCDKPADGSEGHRFSCTVHGKRQVAPLAKEWAAAQSGMCGCGHDVTLHRYGMRRGCTHGVDDGATCECKAWHPVERTSAQKRNADRGPVAVIPRFVVLDATHGVCVSCGRDTVNDTCVGCRESGGECMCPVTP